MEPLLVENHEQGVKEAGGDHHKRHRPAEKSEYGQVSVSVVIDYHTQMIGSSKIVRG